MHDILDAFGRSVRLARPAKRVVSLVPSETESVASLAGIDVLVGRTDFCEEPHGAIEKVPSIGGTKKFDVDAVLALRPDLVLANREENARPLVERLIAEGAPVYVSFQCTVPEAVAHLGVLSRLLGADPHRGPVAEAHAALERAQKNTPSTLRPTFVPIWMDPLMTFDGRTYASDLLELAGARNVFSDRPRRYPLAADLGLAPAWSTSRSEGRDTRYPRIRREEIVERRPELILLPDEPHRFDEADADRFRALDFGTSPRPELVFTSGKDLFWSSTRLAPALDRLTKIVRGS